MFLLWDAPEMMEERDRRESGESRRPFPGMRERWCVECVVVRAPRLEGEMSPFQLHFLQVGTEAVVG